MVSIKTKEEIEKMKKAGHVNYLTHQYLKSLIKPGITTKYLNDDREKIKIIIDNHLSTVYHKFR